MPASSSVFPAFITDEYQPGSGFPDFERAAGASGTRAGAAMAANAKAQFESDFSEIQKIAQDALSVPRTNSGSLDLGVQQYRDAAAAAQAQAIALREVTVAAEQAAKATGDTSEATRLYIQAARAAAVEAESNAEAAAMQATSMERLQLVLSQNASATQSVIRSANSYGNSLGGLHQNTMTAMFAQMELMHVVSMGTDAYAAGIPITRVVAMEAGRLGEALIFISQASGNATGMFGSFARFVGSGFGSAIILGGSLIASLVVGLSKAGDQAEKSAEQFKKVVEAADAFGTAQSELGKVIDLTTGKMKTQNEVLVEAVRLQAELALLAANQKIGDLLPNSAPLAAPMTTVSSQGSPGLDPAAAAAADALQAKLDPQIKAITDAFIAVVNNDALANQNPHQYSLDVGKAIDTAIAAVDRLAKSGKGAASSLADAKKNLIEIGVAAEQKAAALESISVLNGGPAPDLKKPPKDNSDEIRRLIDEQQALGRSIEAAKGPFEEQAGAARQAEAAYRALDAVQQKLNDDNAKYHKLKGGDLPDLAQLNQQIAAARQAITAGEVSLLEKPFEEAPKNFEKARQALAALAQIANQHPDSDGLLAKIANARDVIENGLSKPLADYIKQQQQAEAVQNLLNTGHVDEANLLQAKYALMRAIGAETDAELDSYLKAVGYQGTITDYLRAQVELTHQQTLAQQALQDRIRPYLTYLQSVQQTIEGTINSLEQGKLLTAGGNLVKGLEQSFQTMVSQTLTEKLFGNVFRSLQDQINGHDPVKAASARMAQALDDGRAEMAGWTSALDDTRQRIADYQAAHQAAVTALGSFTTAVQTATGALGGIGSGGGGSPVAATGAQVLASAKSYVGLNENHDTAALESLFKQANINVDPRMTAWCAAFVNAVLATEGIRGTGSLAASSFLNFGTPTTNPQPGDIAVMAHHVGFFDGFNAAGNPIVTGGNQHGGGVNTESFPASDVLSYRTINDLSTAAQAANDNFAQLTQTVAGLQDPLTDADKLFNDLFADATSDSAAPDQQEIVVSARRLPQQAQMLSPFDMMTKTLSANFTAALKSVGINPESANKIGNIIGGLAATAIQGAAYGTAASNLVLGSKGSNTGAALGGALGNILGKGFGDEIGDAIGGSLGSAVGQAAGPIGSIVGGLAGSLIGGLFKTVKQAGSTFSVDQFGNVKVNAGSGDSASASNAVAEATSAVGQIQSIAKQLGASIVPSALTGVTLGYRASDKNQPYRVDTLGEGRATGSGVLAYATEDEAVAEAVQLMLQRGVISGISAASQKILASGQDIQTALEKATAIEQIPTQLEAMVNPAQSAIDALNKQFAQLISYLKEGGATAAQFAQAQQLYNLQREQAITQAQDSMTGAFQGLIDDLGNFSLQDQLASAMAKYNPLAAQIQSGDYSNASGFQSAAEAVAKILQQLDGSQGAYYDFVDQAMALAKQALGNQQGLIDAANATASPFDSSSTGTSGSGNAANDNTVGAINNVGGILSGQISGQLAGINDTLSSIQGILQSQGQVLPPSQGGFASGYNF